MQLTSKFNKGFRFLLCVIDIFSENAWFIPLKDKNGIMITNVFQKFLDESYCKPYKIRVDKGREFHNRSIKSWLEKNGIEMYSTHNEGKSLAAKRFIRTLKNKIYKYITSISKNVYIDKLDDIANKYNNTYHSTCTDSSKEIYNKDPKFKIGDIVRISKYKTIFAKGYVPNWSKEVFAIKRIKSTVLWTYVISDLKGEEIVETFYKKKQQKTNQKEFRAEKVIKRKGDELYVKWKGYNNSFNSWIHKKDIV